MNIYKIEEIAEKVFWSVILCVIMHLIILGITSKKHTVRYELGGTTNGVPTIIKDIENYADETIYLSKEITWNQAIHMVDSLNKTLKPLK